MDIQPLINKRYKYKIISPGVIRGHWNEDDTPFTITCPVQLQVLLVYLLNNLDTDIIEIEKSPNADSRSATKKVTQEELLLSSKKHINDVITSFNFLISLMRSIAIKHDYTKIEHIEEFYNNFKYVQDGNLGDFKKMNWFKSHILEERHHLNDRCPEDVNLLDVLEKIVDSVVAGMSRTGEVYEDNLDVEILKKAYQNTINLIKKHIKVIT